MKEALGYPGTVSRGWPGGQVEEAVGAGIGGAGDVVSLQLDRQVGQVFGTMHIRY